jgi:hypothetical protein
MSHPNWKRLEVTILIGLYLLYRVLSMKQLDSIEVFFVLGST